VVGSQVGASDGSRAGLQGVQGPRPQPAPRVGHTPAHAISTSKRKNVVPKDVPRPRPPPKPGACPSPSSASRAVHALAATAAASHNMNFVPRHLAAARLEVPQGKPTSLMQPQPLSAVHPFTPTMNKWRHGIEVDCGPDWSWEVVETAVAQGPHPTAATPDSIALFKEDIALQGDALGGPPPTPAQSQNLAGGSGSATWTTRQDYLRPIISGVSRCQWSGHSGVIQCE
jgi:hypothetical protein